MKRFAFIIFLFTSHILFSFGQEQARDSLEISETEEKDTTLYEGSTNCLHAWIEGEISWVKERERAGNDSLRLANLPPKSILPRICSKCLRKEYRIRTYMIRKVESEYSRLSKKLKEKTK